VEQALQISQGGPMAAIKALVVANTFLSDENERLRAQISTGYVRCHPKKAAS
jgi:hypothetical protein